MKWTEEVVKQTWCNITKHFYAGGKRWNEQTKWDDRETNTQWIARGAFFRAHLQCESLQVARQKGIEQIRNIVKSWSVDHEEKKKSLASIMTQ